MNDKPLGQWTPHERSLLESLDALITSKEIRAQIHLTARRVAHKLAENSRAPMAWKPLPLRIFGDRLPATILSSWVFILRAGTATGAERHPNSHQRMMSFEGSGDLQSEDEGQWKSHPLVSDPDARLMQRWISIPSGVWHQALVPHDGDWVVVSFHTASVEELIEERRDARDSSRTHQSRYVPSEPGSRGRQ